MRHEPVEGPSRMTAIAAWAGAGTLVAVIWAVAPTFLSYDRSEAIDAAVRENQNRAIAFEQYVTRTLETADVAAGHLASRMAEALGGTGAGGRPVPLHDAIAGNRLFAEVIVTDARGKARYSTVPDAPPLDLGASRRFRMMRETGSDGPLLSTPRFSKELNIPVFSVTRAVRDSSNRFLGAVVVRIPVRQLTAFNEGARIRPLDMISVIRLDGMTLGRRTGNRVSYGEKLAGKLVMRQQLQDPNGTYLGPSALDGIPRYFSHRRLTEYPVFVTIGIGESEVLAPVREHKAWAIAAATALSGTVAALALLISVGARRREKAAEQLREANRRFNAAQRIARIGDWTCDPASGTVSLSAALCEMYGRPADRNRLPLKRAMVYFDKAGRARIASAIEAAIATRQAQQCECVAGIRSGAKSIRRIVLTPLLSRDGKVEMLSGTDQDISQERQNARMRDEIAHRERVESMNLMAATLAHELAQPLTAAANYVMVARIEARAEGVDAGDPDGALERADEQLSLAQEIMRRASDMVSRRRGDEESASLAAIVKDAVYLVKVANRLKSVEIDVPPLAEDLRVAANKVQIQQVLMNLLRNAVEALGDADQPRVAIRAEIDDESLLIRVEDNGPGFPPGAEDGFAPFGAETSRGLGLGLSISKTIVEAYGGSIWLDRTAPVGAAICFRLPRAA